MKSLTTLATAFALLLTLSATAQQAGRGRASGGLTAEAKQALVETLAGPDGEFAAHALYTALYGPRFAPTSGLTVARSMGLERMPLDSMLVFHVVFGKTVPDVSLNAVANLGYAGGLCAGRKKLKTLGEFCGSLRWSRFN